MCSRFPKLIQMAWVCLILVSVGDELIGQNAKPARNTSRASKRLNNSGKNNQQYTHFGSVKLTDVEIKDFLKICEREKPKLLELLRTELNGDNLPNGPAVDRKELFAFVSQKELLLVPRHWTGTEAKPGLICKAVGEQNSVVYPFVPAETVTIIDRSSALIKFHVHEPAIIEGIDTSKLPRGKWDSYLLLRAAGTKQLPAVIGNKEFRVYEAVSKEGFPKDVVLW